jgi:uncharacterized protein with PIN domain
MEIIRNDGCSSYGTACTQCNDLLIAPERSWHVGEHDVYHFWSCENCGHSWWADATKCGGAREPLCV